MDNRCLRCGHEWAAPRDIPIEQCPKCKSQRWNVSIEQRTAKGRVAQAVKGGKLPKLDGTIPCADCGKPATQYDHRDYNKPLDVEPVCTKCNSKRGRAVGRIDRCNIAINLTTEELKEFRRWALDTDSSSVKIMTELLREALRKRVAGRK